MKHLNVPSKERGQQSVQIHEDEEPNKCPFCHHTISPDRLNGHITPFGLELYFRCTNQTCLRHFTAYYVLDEKQANNSIYRYSHTTIGNFVELDFTENITKVSPSFPRIYNQASAAENMQLEEIAGMGYRKAVEFLLKDYAIYRDPDSEEEIKSKLLGRCISDHINDGRIKDVAKRAVWLGNDETHYVRRWEDKDISDLKKLIDITVHWIEMEMLSEDYLDAMP